MLRLMVVDDEVEICDFVKNFFQERNFEVISAFNGNEAMDLIMSKKPHIILLDVMMPAMDGLQTLKEIKEKDVKTSVVMVTAVEDSKKIEEAKRYGVVEYITKPLLLEDLEKTVSGIAAKLSIT